MVDSKLLSYIQEQLKKGYDINSIKNYLIKYGYPQDTINYAISQLNNKSEVKHTIHFSGTVVITIAIIALALAGITVGFFLFTENSEEQLLDINIESMEQSFEPGEDINFMAYITSMGSKKRYDIIIKYELIDQNNGNIINFGEQTKAIETTLNANLNLNIPFDTSGGRYIIKTTAIYNGKQASSTLPITIIDKQEEPTCNDGIKNQDEEEIDCGGPCNACKECPINCDDNNKCTKDSCDESTLFECEHKTISPCCGNNICEPGETGITCSNDCQSGSINTPQTESSNEKKQILDNIKNIALSDKNKAIEECSKLGEGAYSSMCFREIGIITKDESVCTNINNENNKDNCYIQIAKSIENSEICDKIHNEGRRDGCYMSFVSEGDYTICSKIVNEWGKKSCENLKLLKG